MVLLLVALLLEEREQLVIMVVAEEDFMVVAVQVFLRRIIQVVAEVRHLFPVTMAAMQSMLLLLPVILFIRDSQSIIPDYILLILL